MLDTDCSLGSRPSRRTILLSLVIALLAWAGSAPGQGKTQPKLIGAAVVTVDRATGTGETVVSLQNGSNKPLPVLLSAGSLAQAGSAKTSEARVTFAAENAPGNATPTRELSIPADSTLGVVVRVENAWETGQFETDLENRQTKIGKLKVAVFTVNVKLDGPTPDKLELNLVDGRPARIYLKNEDPAPYALAYRLVIDDRQVATGNFTMTREGTAALEFTPKVPFRPFLARMHDLFKPEATDGHVLLLALRAGDNPADFTTPVKRIPVKAGLNFFSPGSREALGYVVIVFVLIAGGVLSLILTHLLPNRLQKLDLVERLGALARSTADLSTRIGSQLGVLVRVERRRLLDFLNSRTTISPDFANLVTQGKQGAATLATRVAMLQQMDSVWARLETREKDDVPPTQVEEIRKSLENAGTLLSKSQPAEADVRAAQAAIDEAARALDTLGRPSDEARRMLVQRVKAELSDQKPADFQKKFDDFKVPGPGKVLVRIDGVGAIDQAAYAEVDRALEKMTLIKRYWTLRDSTTDDKLKDRLGEHEAELVGLLQLDSIEALRSARLLFRQMQDGVYPEQLEKAANDQTTPGASILVDPTYAYELQPLMFRVAFADSRLDDAEAARQAWTIEWNFGDGLSERGGSVSHFFLLPRSGLLHAKRQKTFKVVATLPNAKGEGGKRVELSQRVTVHPSTTAKDHQRTITEGVRLAAVLLIAVFALVAGAREQLLKLDVLPGLVAVFLVGFGADSIKNLLTSK
jgi:hypothetical protein